jgi:hypothetical protein
VSISIVILFALDDLVLDSNPLSPDEEEEEEDGFFFFFFLA